MTKRIEIPWQEWAWVAVASLLVMAFVSMPYIIGMRNSTPEMVFSGHVLCCLVLNESLILALRRGLPHAISRRCNTFPPSRAGCCPRP